MMLRRIKFSPGLVCLLLLLNSCRQENNTSNAFLIRNNLVVIDEYRQKLLQETNTNKVYIKIFDVVFNEWQQRPLPLAQVEFDSTSLKWLKSSGIEIVPVLYINNDLLEKINADRVNALTDRIMILLKTRLDQFDLLKINTVHLDCDWSPGSKDKYFQLLNYLQLLPYFVGKQISVAVRPKQVEDSEQFGLPPVKRAVYTIDLQHVKFNPEAISGYPLPLDLCLPIFNEPVVFRNSSAIDALSGLPDSVWMDERVSRNAGDFLEVTKDTLVSTHYFKRGDRIEYSNSDTAALSRIARLIQPKLKSSAMTIILNELDSVKIRQYGTGQLKAALDLFNKD
jgi:hypothetical protein